MDTAKLFSNGRSQALRLPKAFRFVGTEVYIKKVPEGVLLIAKDDSVWEAWEKNLSAFAGPIDIARDPGTPQQQREGLDDLFT